MADLSYAISAVGRGTGREREGTISVDGHTVTFSAPANMGGKGSGASPETLLLSAVTACYSLTLLAILQKRQLAVESISVQTDGTVTGHPRETKFAAIVVNPGIHGGDVSRAAEYRGAADEACTICFIGQTVAAGGVAYNVGTVTVV
jgi:peroxiredoxin-like protein